MSQISSDHTPEPHPIRTPVEQPAQSQKPQSDAQQDPKPTPVITDYASL